MNLIEIERHKKIVEQSSELLKFCDESDRDYINKILNNSKQEIKKANKQDLKVYDITPTEKGRFIASCQRIVSGYFYNNKNEHLKYSSNCLLITKKRNDLLNKYTLLRRRKIGNPYRADEPLEKEVREYIKNEIIKEYQLIINS